MQVDDPLPTTGSGVRRLRELAPKQVCLRPPPPTVTDNLLSPPATRARASEPAQVAQGPTVTGWTGRNDTGIANLSASTIVSATTWGSSWEGHMALTQPMRIRNRKRSCIPACCCQPLRRQKHVFWCVKSQKRSQRKRRHLVGAYRALCDRVTGHLGGRRQGLPHARWDDASVSANHHKRPWQVAWLARLFARRSNGGWLRPRLASAWRGQPEDGGPYRKMERRQGFEPDPFCGS